MPVPLAFTLLLAMAEFPATDPAIYTSPYNTVVDHAGALWIYPGAYLKTGFTGTKHNVISNCV